MSNAASFFWHDYETSGAIPAVDRPMQFAGLRTDADFKLIGEPLMIYCQPTTDLLPHPEAAMITGITPQQALAEGLPEPEFIAAIYAEMSRPNTCSLGYNSLRFDDEVTRYTLWRNFFPPYDREWKNGCNRWDLIDVARMTYALRPEGIEWPRHADGKPSFKLEDLAQANGIGHEQAHDALSDVWATIGLAKLIKSKQPKLFEFAFNNRGKHQAGQLLNPAQPQPVVHVSSKFPAEQGCLSLILPLGMHPKNKNCVICFDLRHEPYGLLDLDAEDIRERLFTPAADLPEGVERVALKGVHLNKCPVLAPLAVLNAASQARCQIDLAQCQQHADWLLDHRDELLPLAQQAFAHASFESSAEAEQGLYEGFLSDTDRQLCDEVRGKSSFELQDWEPPFEDDRLHDLLFRYRARHYPETLNDAERDEWENWRANKLEFAPNGGISLAEAEFIIQALRSKVAGDANKEAVLSALGAWMQEIKP